MNRKYAYFVGAIVVIVLLAYDLTLLGTTNSVLLEAKAIDEIKNSPYAAKIPSEVLTFAEYYQRLHPQTKFEIVKEGDGKISLYAVEGENQWKVWRGVYLTDEGEVIRATVFFYDPYYVKDYVTIEVNLTKKTKPIRVEIKESNPRPMKVISANFITVGKSVNFQNPTLYTLKIDSNDFKISEEISKQIKETVKERGLGRDAEFVLAHEFVRAVLANNGWWINLNKDWYETGKVTVVAFGKDGMTKEETYVGGILEGILLSGGTIDYQSYFYLTLAEVCILRELGFDAKVFEYTPIQEANKQYEYMYGVRMNPYLVAIKEDSLNISELKETFFNVPELTISMEGAKNTYVLFDPIPDPSWQSIPLPEESKAVMYEVA